MPACPAPRDWSFMVAPPLATVAVIAVGRTAPASADAAQLTPPHGNKTFPIATPYPYACRPPARTPLTRDASSSAQRDQSCPAGEEARVGLTDAGQARYRQIRGALDEITTRLVEA